MNEQRLLTVREVAERLRSSPETVRRWLRQGKLRGFRPGGTKLGYRVPESELHVPGVRVSTQERQETRREDMDRLRAGGQRSGKEARSCGSRRPSDGAGR